MAVLDLAVSMNSVRQAAYLLACRKSKFVSRSAIQGDTFGAGTLLTDDGVLAFQRLESGGSVLLADPFLLPADERDRLAKSNRVMPLMTTRHDPAVQHILEQLGNGCLGQPGLLRVHHWQPQFSRADSSLSCWLDIALQVFAGRIDSVCAVQHNEALQAHLGFRNGGMALIGTDTIPRQPGYFSMTLVGSAGAAYADDHHNAQLLFHRYGTTGLLSETLTPDLSDVLGNFANFVAGLQDASSLWSEVEKIASLARAVRESADAGKVCAGDCTDG